MTTGQCPSDTYAGSQFNNHYDGVLHGYAFDHTPFKQVAEK